MDYSLRVSRKMIATDSSPDRARQFDYISGNVNSHVFHGPNCPQYNCKNRTKELSSREAAIVAGFCPCGICRP